MIIYHQKNVAAFAGAHTYWFLPHQILTSQITVTSATIISVLPTVLVRVHLGLAPDNKAPLSLSMADADVKIRVQMTDTSLEVH